MATSVIRLSILARAPLRALFAATHSAVCLSRLLLLFVAVEAVTMPITQGIWSWDKFLHGGQDFELGLLMILTCLCLVLLRVQESRSRVGWLAVIRAFLLTATKPEHGNLLSCPGQFDHRSEIPPLFRAGVFNLPLLI
jgi:hypothetical protein